MASLFGGGGAGASSSGSQNMQQRKDQLKQDIQQQLALANAQQLISKMNENCFEKCISPSTKLSSSEESCLSRCMALYSAAFDQVSQKYTQRVMKERVSLPGGQESLDGTGSLL